MRKLPNLPLAEHTVCKPGDRYLVRCLFVQRDCRVGWIPRDGWMPVIGPKHTDAEHLEFPFEHFHIDWRFVVERQLERVYGAPHSQVITSATGLFDVSGPVELKVRTCRRVMPTFPAPPRRYTATWRRWQHLERAQAFTCNKLKPGGICPHRGIDLTPFAQPDGTAICPGHGLRWNLATGELMPRFAA